MASMTIRNIDDQLMAQLRMRVTAHGRSMEDEARDILRAALSVEDKRPSHGSERKGHIGYSGTRTDPSDRP